MELAEVVNPHFAVPIVGVVLCVFLVFAFGFKSPVQPPSFIFEDESKKSRARSKQKKKGPPVATPEPVVSKQSPSPKVTTKPAVETIKEQSVKTKVKTTTGSPKLTASKQKTKTAPKPAEDNDDGEWTTARSKKKKPRATGKKDELQASDLTERMEDVINSDVPAVVLEVEDVTPALQSTSEDVIKKDVNKVKEDADETSMQIKPISTIAAPPPTQPTTTTTTAASSKKKAKKERRAEPPVVTKDILHAAGDNATADGSHLGDANGTQRKIEAEILAAMQDDEKTIVCGAGGDHVALVAATVKSPKKKKKGKELKPAAQPAMKLAEKLLSASHPSEPLVSSVIQKDVPVEASRTVAPPPTTEPAPSSTEPTAAVDSSKSSAITFDELGDWQEAKLVKKKKKVRRDN